LQFAKKSPSRKAKAIPAHRIRGRKLQAIRAGHFRANPLCVRCQAIGRVALATELDHKIALANGGEDTESNRQGLCADCHKAKTREDCGQREQTQFDSDGRVVW
jgi:5-methylcytosine-specific restriction protein A